MKMIAASFGLCLGAATAIPSFASTVTLDFLGNIDQGEVSAQIDGTEIEPMGNNEFDAGRLSFRDVGAVDAFVAWCLEVTQLIAAQADYTTGTSLLDPGRENLISRLFTGYSDATSSDVGAAALQLAIWEIVEEDTATSIADLDVTSGRFTAASSTANIVQTANLFLSTLDQFDANYRINYFQSADSQDIISVAPIPLPAGILLLGVGVGGLALMRRRQA